METAYLGGGCFWCTEAIFQMLKGVSSVTPGYAGGKMDNPSYEDVGEGTTGHAEVIKIEFDPSVIPYRDLLDIFFPHITLRNGINKERMLASNIGQLFYIAMWSRRESPKRNWTN